MAVTRLHWLSMIALAVTGVIILVLSLMAANQLTVAGTHTPASGFKLYFGRTMLPDHVAYSFLMLRDRLRLENASPQEQIFLKLEFAEHRYQAAVSLLEAGQDQLALTTMNKSQKYVMSAGYQLLEQETMDLEKVAQVRAAVDSSIYRTDQFLNAYTSPNKEELTQLRDESRVLLQKIDERRGAAQ